MNPVTADACVAYIKALTGYAADTESALISYILETETQHILNVTNQDAVPEDLYAYLRDRVAGQFLTIKKAAVLGDDNLSVVSSIKEGDVQVNLSGTSAEQRLDEIIALLSREADLLCFRKLRW